MCVLLSFIIQIQNEFKVEKLFFSETKANKEYVISAQEFICFSVSNNTMYVCMYVCNVIYMHLESNNIHCFYATLLSLSQKNNLLQ